MNPKFSIYIFAYMFFFFFFASSAIAQIELKNKILDFATLMPLENASIYIENTTIGTISNSDGKFLLVVNNEYAKDTLVISSIGYKSFKTPVDEFDNQVEIYLEEDVASLDEVVLVGGSLLAGLALPLSAIQIIWVNLFTGSLPAIAFAFDQDGHFKSAEKGKGVIIDKEVKFLTLGIGVLSSVLLFVLYWLLLYFSVELSLARSVLFACFASYILLIAFSIRNLSQPLFSYPIFDNKVLVSGVAAGLALLAATLYMPILQNFFGIIALPPVWLLLVGGWMVFNVALVEGAKWIFYRPSFKKLSSEFLRQS